MSPKNWLLSTLYFCILFNEGTVKGTEREKNQKNKNKKTTSSPNLEQNGSVTACPVESKSPEAPEIPNWFAEMLFTYFFRWNMHCGRAHAFRLEFEPEKLQPVFPQQGATTSWLCFFFFLRELFLQSHSKPGVGFYYKSVELFFSFPPLKRVAFVIGAREAVASGNYVSKLSAAVWKRTKWSWQFTPTDSDCCRYWRSISIVIVEGGWLQVRQVAYPTPTYAGQKQFNLQSRGAEHSGFNVQMQQVLKMKCCLVVVYIKTIDFPSFLCASASCAFELQTALKFPVKWTIIPLKILINDN